MSREMKHDERKNQRQTNNNSKKIILCILLVKKPKIKYKKNQAHDVETPKHSDLSAFNLVKP